MVISRFSYGKISKPIGALHEEGKHPHPFHLPTIWGINPRQKINGRCQCYLFPYSGWTSPIQFTFGGSSEHVKKSNKTCAYYKSEEDDITEANVDSLTSAEGSSEAVVVEGNVQNVSAWWEDFPKRWVIVVLCFTAFLLCNMDRVSIFMVLFV